MKLHTPRHLDEALRLLSEATTPVTPVAGGTDLLVSWHHRPVRDLTLLDLSRLDGDLRTLRLTDDHLHIGAMTTYWDVRSSKDVCDAFPLMMAAARQVGALQIQTRGTWAGNIGNGSPAADGVPVMMAYDAVVILQSVHGTRHVRLDEYWTGYKQSVRRANELIVGMVLPRRNRSLEWFHKVGARSAQTITKVGVAVVHDDLGWRVCANSVAPFVCRCRHLESELATGRRFANAREMREALAHDVKPIDDLRSTAEYRLNVLARILFFRLASQTPGTTAE